MKKAGIVGLVSLYVAAAGAAAFAIDQQSDLDIFFLPSVAYALAGHPLSAYAVRVIHGALVYADANGPLSLIPLTAIAWVGARIGWLGQLRLQHVLVTAAFSTFALVMAHEAVRAIDGSRAMPLTRRWRLVAYAVLAASPVLWLSLVDYGHIEQPISIALILVAVRALGADRPGLAGLAIGLTGLTRTLTLVFAIPLLILQWQRRGPAAALRTSAIAALTIAIGMLPFLIADGRDVIFSMVRQHADLPIGIGSVWYLVGGTPLGFLGLHADTTLIALATIFTTLLFLRVRPGLGFESGDLYGVMAIAGLWMVLLIKIVWPYYLIEPFVFAAIWTLTVIPPSWRRWLVPAAIAVAAYVAEFATHREQTPGGLLGTAAVVALLLACVADIGWTIMKARPRMATERHLAEAEFQGAAS